MVPSGLKPQSQSSMTPSPIQYHVGDSFFKTDAWSQPPTERIRIFRGGLKRAFSLCSIDNFGVHRRLINTALVTQWF